MVSAFTSKPLCGYTRTHTHSEPATFAVKSVFGFSQAAVDMWMLRAEGSVVDNAQQGVTVQGGGF